MLQQVHGQLTTSNVRHKLSLDFHQNVNGQADLILQHGKKDAHANELSMSNKSMQHDGMVSCSLSTWAFPSLLFNWNWTLYSKIPRTCRFMQSKCKSPEFAFPAKTHTTTVPTFWQSSSISVLYTHVQTSALFRLEIGISIWHCNTFVCIW